MISTSVSRFDQYELAEEAVSEGAVIVVFPEWGYTSQPDVAPEVLDRWRSLADSRDVYILVDVRLQSKNALKIFTPDPAVEYTYFRRDGKGSPYPVGFDRPLVFETPYGRLAVLLCDEVRTKKFVRELRSYLPDGIIAPNQTNATYAYPLSVGAVASDAENVGYFTSVYSADVLRENADYTWFYEPSSQTIERNAFGAPRAFNPDDVTGPIPDFLGGTKRDSSGNPYYISYHPIVPLDGAPKGLDLSAESRGEARMRRLEQ